MYECDFQHRSHLLLFMYNNQVRMRTIRAEKTMTGIHTEFSRWKSATKQHDDGNKYKVPCIEVMGQIKSI